MQVKYYAILDIPSNEYLMLGHKSSKDPDVLMRNLQDQPVCLYSEFEISRLVYGKVYNTVSRKWDCLEELAYIFVETRDI